MRRSDLTHARGEGGWLGRALAALLVVALVAGGVVAWRLDLLDALRDSSDDTGTPAGPAAVPPPPGLELPALTDPPPVDTALQSPGLIDDALVRAAVAPHLADPVLGGHVVGMVADLSAGGPVVDLGGGAAIPASTTKLLTTTAALSVLGPETRFATRVLTVGKGRLVLVGGGDPFLASEPLPTAYPARADVVTLAQQTAAALAEQGRSKVRLGYDDSLFSEPSFNPRWPASYLPENVVSRVTSLWVDEGHASPGSGIRATDPSLAAAQAFAAALTEAGIRVVGDPTRGVASGGTELTRVESAPLREIAARVLEVSDNEAAEVLSHQVGLAVAGTATFADGAAAVTQTLAGLGVPMDGVSIHDGSGLSRENLITPAALVGVLRVVLDPAHPELDAVATGLPVAGFTGSLTNRFDAPYPLSRGLVRAKTGTLTAVSSLAGIAVDQDGHQMLFALMADRIKKPDETKAQNALDAAAGALGSCRCGIPTG